MMTLSNIRINELLPRFMQNEGDNAAMSAVLDEAVKEIAGTVRLFSVWDKIDELPEELLDEIAWGMDMSWYDTGADIDTKRALIKSADYVYQHLGTKASIMSFLESFFDYAEVSEWFEYGGEPGHYTINVEAPDPDAAARFLSFISPVARQSAVLDGIVLTEPEAGGITGTAAMRSSYVAPDLYMEED